MLIKSEEIHRYRNQPSIYTGATLSCTWGLLLLVFEDVAGYNLFTERFPPDIRKPNGETVFWRE